MISNNNFNYYNKIIKIFNYSFKMKYKIVNKLFKIQKKILVIIAYNKMS